MVCDNGKSDKRRLRLNPENLQFLEKQLCESIPEISPVLADALLEEAQHLVHFVLAAREDFEQRLAEEQQQVEQTTLDGLMRQVLACKKCNLRDSCERPVIGTGDCPAELLVVFDQGSLQAVETIRQEILTRRPGTRMYFTHVVKCATGPPEEVRVRSLRQAQNCAADWLVKEAELIQPKVMLLLGDLAVDAAIKGRGVSRERESNPHIFGKVPVYVTYHPAEVVSYIGVDGRVPRNFGTDLDRVVKELRK